MGKVEVRTSPTENGVRRSLNGDPDFHKPDSVERDLVGLSGLRGKSSDRRVGRRHSGPLLLEERGKEGRR